MANWTIVFIKAGQDRQLRDIKCVTRETALGQAHAYLQQGDDVLRIVEPNGEVVLLNEIEHRTDQKASRLVPASPVEMSRSSANSGTGPFLGQ